MQILVIKDIVSHSNKKRTPYAVVGDKVEIVKKMDNVYICINIRTKEKFSCNVDKLKA